MLRVGRCARLGISAKIGLKSHQATVSLLARRLVATRGSGRGGPMGTQDLVNIALAVLVPVVTAVVGAIGVAFQDWRVRRSTT